MMKLIVYSILALLSIEVVQSMSKDGGSCKVEPEQRVECGWSGISKLKCLSQKGCCFDRSVRNAITCFKNSERAERVPTSYDSQQKFFGLFAFNDNSKDDKAVLKSCSAEPRDKIACGWTSISRKVCEYKGCCYAKPESPGMPWCFQPDSRLVSRTIRDVLECTWECSRMTWYKISFAYSQCSTNAPCWRERIGQGSETCLSACKVEKDIQSYKEGLAKCLGLDREITEYVHLECDTAIPCWVDRFGYSALACFRKVENIGEVVGFVSPEEQKEEYFPEYERTNHLIEREQPISDDIEILEENTHMPGPPGPENDNILRTLLSVEKASHHGTEVNMNTMDEEDEDEYSEEDLLHMGDEEIMY